VTFKRVMLVVLPLMGAVFCFMVLRWIYLDWEASLTDYRPEAGQSVREIPAGGREMQTPGGFLHDRTENLNLTRKDADGRVQMRFLADVVEHRTAKTADIHRPRIQFFTSSGEVITLLADKGLAVTKGPLLNADDIESGRLWGNLVLVHDRGTPEDFTDDIFVSLEDLEFDNTTYEMATDGPVVMVGGEMSLTARKMRMALDRETRRINTMTFFEDILITLETGERMNFLQGKPEEKKEPAEPAPTTPSAPLAADSSQPPSPEDQSGNLWRMDLAGDVDARQATQRLRCGYLSLYNTQREPEKTGEAGQGQAGEAEGKTTAEAQAEAEAETKALLIVIADGPLIVTPVGPEERKALGDKQHQVEATGRPVRIEDGETVILGDAVQFNQKTGVATIIGKDEPIFLEQPGRLHLTGQRLDFYRNADPPRVEVKGGGRLQAEVQTSGLTPSVTSASAGETAKPVEPSPLDASWKRGMELALYSLPSGETGGLGEIKSAAFHGQAVLNQAGGILKGDDLFIEFFPAKAEKGQAVERLTGKGNVYLKNAEPPKTDAASSDVKPAIGDIACRKELEILFERDASGDTQPKRLKAKGDVAINDPQGKVRAEDLTVEFDRNEEGKMEARFLEAFGNVLIDRADLHAEGDHVRQDRTAGSLLLEGKPARARRLHQVTTAAGEKVEAQSRVVGPRIEFSETEGKARVTGAGELELPATSDLQGRPRDKPEPLIVEWTRSMLFEDSRNFAHFDGAVKAKTGGSRLDAQRLWIYFADVPKTETAEPDAAKAGQAKSLGSEMTSLFGERGEKRLVRLLAENDVLAIDEQLADDGTVRHRMEMIGDNLTFLEQNRKAYMRGPGRLRILARERTRDGENVSPGLPPDKAPDHWKGDVPSGYARTAVGWAESMAYDGTTERAYFSGEVDATHIGRGVPGEGDTQRRTPTNTRITCRDLQVVFGQKPPASETAPAAEPAPAPNTPPEQRMTVEKLVADGDVMLWVDDRRGSGARLLYQREPELIRLYRGPGPDEWARLWQENEATQEFGLIAARTITYDPSSGRVDVVDQQVMTMAPKPKPVPKPLPKLVPGTKP